MKFFYLLFVAGILSVSWAQRYERDYYGDKVCNLWVSEVFGLEFVWPNGMPLTDLAQHIIDQLHLKPISPLEEVMCKQVGHFAQQ